MDSDSENNNSNDLQRTSKNNVHPNANDPSSGLSRPTNDNENENDATLNSSDTSPVQPPTDSADQSVMEVDNTNTENTHANSLSVKTEESASGDNEQQIYNNQNASSSREGNELTLEPVLTNDQEIENITTSNEIVRASNDDVDVSPEENNAPQGGGNQHNQGSVENNDLIMDTDQMNEHTSKLVDDPNENTDPKETVHMNTASPTDNLHNDDTENDSLDIIRTLPDPPKTPIETPDPIENKKFKFNNSPCQFRSDKNWLKPQYHDANGQSIKKPNEIEDEMDEPPGEINPDILNRIQGSIIGMALGDALGAHVEFRPRQFMVDNPVKDLKGGGTWGLEKGQFTDDTSMALCLANSLVACRDFVPYDQLVRYKWWYKFGYMSSTGHCFDIGAATRQSIQEFEHRQKRFAKSSGINFEDMDSLSDPEVLKQFDVYCSEDDVAGNGALMRLAPVPLFFYRHPEAAVELSGYSGQITHGDKKAYDACRYYGALIVAALHNTPKHELLATNFYSNHKNLFGGNELHPDIQSIAEGSYQKKNGYDDGIRGKGYIVNALEAALWAFWSDEDSFEKGALAAVNLGDDTDTTAAIYGQLAGAYYGYKNLPEHWLKHVYAKKFMETLSKWIVYEGECWQNAHEAPNSQL